MTYLVDTNIFVEAQRRYYGFDIVPSFWNFLDAGFQKGDLVSIRPVLDEIKKGNDDLTAWAKDRPGYFKPVDDLLTLGKMSEIADWVAQAGFTDNAVSDFLDVADYPLVAYAAAHGLVLLTHEHFNMNAKKRVLIPNVCKQFDVEYADTFEMMRALGAKL